MNWHKITFTKRILSILFLLSIICESSAQVNLKMRSQIDSIKSQIEEITGRKFKHAVDVKRQSLDDFGNYVDKMLSKQFSDSLSKNYGKIVKKLGLYRGPEIEDFKSMAKMVMQSQAAAYYDPSSDTFFIVMQNLPALTLKAVYAHELYHGLQDQHFDLDNYLLSQTGGKLNDDELLARQAVVEGEATYIMTLWTLQNQFGAIPDQTVLQMMINMQSQLGVSQLLSMLKTTPLPQVQSSDMEQALKAMDEIPPFMMETMLGAYLKGMAFIFEIQKGGWERVEKLYSRPPVSTEQILHPKKWLNNEKPYTFSWPSFSESKELENWQLLESNTIGEIQWRIIFTEHNLTEIGLEAAAGWNGDTFAIFENHASDQLLLLIYTSWDSEEDATEFFNAYNKVLQVKYRDSTENVRTKKVGKDILIIEGGKELANDSLMKFMQGIGKSRS